MKLNKVIAIPAVALAAGISLAGCGSQPAVHHAFHYAPHAQLYEARHNDSRSGGANDPG